MILEFLGWSISKNSEYIRSEITLIRVLSHSLLIAIELGEI